MSEQGAEMVSYGDGGGDGDGGGGEGGDGGGGGGGEGEGAARAAGRRRRGGEERTSAHAQAAAGDGRSVVTRMREAVSPSGDLIPRSLQADGRAQPLVQMMRFTETDEALTRPH